LLALFLGLVIMSRDATALICSSLYMTGAYAYTLLTRSRPLGVLAISALSLLSLAVLVVLWASPGADFSFLNRDMTLTGRTNLWPMVLDQIRQRPLFGWGYAATWQETDSGPSMIAKILNWAPGHAHNEWLEITLQLGLVGAALVLSVIAVTVVRGVRCINANRTMLGFFVLLFVLGTAIHGVTEVVLVQSQSIAWVVFSILGFKAGRAGARVSSRDVATGRRIVQTA
jgi:exopolysaccharide production protein ExoQ